MTSEITEFKGNKILVLKRNPEDSWPFSFGLGKAKLILENLDAIKNFVGNEESPKKEEPKLKVDLSNEMPEGEEEIIDEAIDEEI